MRSKLPSRTRLVYRAPRVTGSKGETDSPAGQAMSGRATVALGLAAISFAGISMNRIRVEKKLINAMWKAHTTVRGLRALAAAGKPLPGTVLLRGRIEADGPCVHSILQGTSLASKMGEIDQPANLFLNLADKVKRGEVMLPKSFKYDDLESITDDFSKRSTVLARSLVVNELFITRLGCAATRKKVKNKDGYERIEITRQPRSARFDVLHHRRESEGLHLVDEGGERIPLLLPHRLAAPDLYANLAPSLFLSLPDPMREFKKWMGGTVNIINADKSLTHMSKFVHFDQRSDTDLGGWARSGSRSPRSSSSSASATTALSEIARVVPSGWYWNGKVRLFTVTFCANPANDLTSHPHI